jgi:hypothetical protein
VLFLIFMGLDVSQLGSKIFPDIDVRDPPAFHPGWVFALS